MYNIFFKQGKNTNFSHLGPMPDMYRRTKDEYHLPKGVSNRNKGLVREKINRQINQFRELITNCNQINIKY